MADPLSIAAGVTGLLAFAATTLTKGFTIVKTLQGSASEVKRLLGELSQLTGVLVAIEAQEGKPKRSQPRVEEDGISKILNASVRDCRELLKKTTAVFDRLGKSRKATMAVKWVFIEPEVQKLMADIEHHRSIFVLCLGLDTRKATDQVLDLQMEISSQLLDMKEEWNQEKIQRIEEKAQRDRQALVNWLKPSSDEQQNKAPEVSVPGTGRWFLNDPEYLNWKDMKTPLLWLKGIPGTGKTILMTRAIDDLKAMISSSSQRTALAFFYCSYTKPALNNPTQLLLSLAAQLLRNVGCSDISPAMKLFEECDSGTLAPTLARALDLVTHFAKLFEYTYICLDALDECSEENQEGLLSAIFELRGRCSNLGVLVSSRANHVVISDYLDTSPSINVLPQTSRDDIDLYIRYRISRGPRSLKQFISEELIQRLIVHADGMFLWIVCQMDHILRLRKSSDIQSAFTTLPKGLYGTFFRILSDIEDENRILASRSLQWLAYARAPLSLEDLVQAIAVEDSSTSLQSTDKLFDPQSIFGICGSLIRQSPLTKKLSLAHQSVYEYLTANSAETTYGVPSVFHIPTKEVETDLTKTCLVFLSLRDFNIIRNENLPSTRATEYDHAVEAVPLLQQPFFEYAINHWWQHLPSSEDGIGHVWPQLKVFFDPELGNFNSVIAVLRHLEGEYRYPFQMKPIHYCATLGLSQLFPYLISEAAELEKVEDGRTALHMAIENGSEDFVQLLLCHKETDVSATTLDGRTGLQLALECGYESIVQSLITAGADVNGIFTTGDTPLSLATGNGWFSMVKFLVDSMADPNICLDNERTSLHVAAEAGSEDGTFKLLLDAGANRLATDSNSWTPLHYASYFGQKEAASILLKSSEAENLFRADLWTPLHIAIEEKHIDIAELFEAFAPLLTKSGSLRETQAVLSRSFKETQRQSALSSSRYYKGSGKRNQEISSTSKAPSSTSQRTPSIIPISTSKTSSSAFQRTPSASTPAITPLEASKDVANISSSESNDVLSSDKSVPSPLYIASNQEYVEGVEFLLKAGVHYLDVEECINSVLPKRFFRVVLCLISYSPLSIQHFLAYPGPAGNLGKYPSDNSLCIQYFETWGMYGLSRLIERAVEWKSHHLLDQLITAIPDAVGADIGINRRQRVLEGLRLSLTIALNNEDYTSTRRLLSVGADWAALEGKHFQVMIPSAVEAGDHNVLQKLFNHYTSLPGSHEPEGKETLSKSLVVAAENHDQVSCHLLAAIGAAWRRSDVLKLMEIITYFIRTHNQNMVSLFLSQYAQHNGQVESTLHERANYLDGLTSISETAIQYSSIEALETVISAGAQINQPVHTMLKVGTRDVTEFTLLHLAILWQSSPEMVSYLLSNSMCLNKQDSLGRYPLHYAVRESSDNLVASLLLLHGADVSCKDNDGCTPLHIAFGCGRDDHVQSLIDAGASLFAIDRERRTPLHRSCYAFDLLNTWPSSLTATYLTDTNCAHAKDEYGLYPKELALIKSIERNSPDFLNCVLRMDRGIVNDRLPPLKQTILHIAASRDATNDILEVLLAHNADINALDRDGKTPAKVAGSRARRFLMDHGASMSIRAVRR